MVVVALIVAPIWYGATNTFHSSGADYADDDGSGFNHGNSYPQTDGTLHAQPPARAGTHDHQSGGEA